MSFEHDFDDDRDDPQSIDLDPDDGDDELATVVCASCGSEIIAGVLNCPRCGAYEYEQRGGATRGTRIVAVVLLAAFACGSFWWLRCHVF
ncbi:MAG: hypothetical protein AB7N71_00805 [Phycisphaerae bacterium]